MSRNNCENYENYSSYEFVIATYFKGTTYAFNLGNFETACFCCASFKRKDFIVGYSKGKILSVVENNKARTGPGLRPDFVRF